MSDRSVVHMLASVAQVALEKAAGTRAVLDDQALWQALDAARRAVTALKVKAVQEKAVQEPGTTNQTSPAAVQERVMRALGELVASVEIVHRRSTMGHKGTYIVDRQDFLRMRAAYAQVNKAMPANLEEHVQEAHRRQP